MSKSRCSSAQIVHQTDPLHVLGIIFVNIGGLRNQGNANSVVVYIGAYVHFAAWEVKLRNIRTIIVDVISRFVLCNLA